MKKLLSISLFLTLTGTTLFLPTMAQCWPRHHWYDPGFDYHRWRGGYWFQGAYLNWYGWWWVVDSTWYYYPQPIYPYPNPNAPPAYYVQVQSAPAIVGPTTVQSAQLPTPAPSPSYSPGNSPASGPKPQQAFSYYCAATRSYFPIVRSCDSGWTAIPVKAPQ
jgi:hypothetical protein